MTENIKSEKFIKGYSVALIIIAVMTLLAMLLILRGSASRARELDSLESARDECVSAIGEFSDASDYLTAEVWSYATDGGDEHLKNYWNEVNVARTRDKAVEKLLHSDLTERERVHVMRAKAYSDTLISSEAWSMRLLAESYGVPEENMPRRVRDVQLQPDTQALTAEEKRSMAQKYLFGADYAGSKKCVHDMVSAFNGDISTRLAAGTASALAANQTASRYSLAAVIVLMLLMILLITGYSRVVGRKNRQLTTALDAAQAASSAKSYFTSRMSHEIRTPLNAVLGYLHMAETAASAAEKQQSITKSRIAATNLLGIVNDVLDLSAIESGKMQLSREPYTVSSILGDMSVVYSGIAEDRKLSLTISADELPCDTLLGDRMRINQILTNLMSNAIKFTPQGGAVELRARQIEDGGGLATVYVVRDSGIGMSAEFLPHIFDAYEQENASIHGRFGGSGLGMSIAKSLVDIMGGSIDVQSEKGEGSVFTVILPGETCAEPAASCPDGDGAQRGFSEENTLPGMNILLAEDNDMNTEIASMILTRAGATVTAVKNGEEAVRVFRDSPSGAFEAVLMDIIMPVMDGYEATRRIRALDREDAGRVPIIAMSANALTSDVRQALDSGMNAHTPKPIDIANLIGTLRRFRAQNDHNA